MVAIAISKVLHLRIAPSSYRAKENSELTVDSMRTYAERDRGSEGLPGDGGRGFASGRDYLGGCRFNFFPNQTAERRSAGTKMRTAI
jgi:hypothetical protein